MPEHSREEKIGVTIAYHSPNRASLKAHVDAGHRCMAINMRLNHLQMLTAHMWLWASSSLTMIMIQQKAIVGKRDMQAPFCSRAHPPVCRRL